MSGVATSLRVFGIDYGRKQQPNISPSRRVRRNGGRANRGVRDGGFSAAVAREGVLVGVSATQKRRVLAGCDPATGLLSTIPTEPIKAGRATPR